MVFVLQGGEDGRGTDGGGGRTKTRIARPKHIIKSCVKMHMNSNIHNEFPAPFEKDFFFILGGLFEEANTVEEIAFKYAVDHINRNRFVYISKYLCRDCYQIHMLLIISTEVCL